MTKYFLATLIVFTLLSSEAFLCTAQDHLNEISYATTTTIPEGKWYGKYRFNQSLEEFSIVMDLQSDGKGNLKGQFYWPEFFNTVSTFSGTVQNGVLLLKNTGLRQGYNMKLRGEYLFRFSHGGQAINGVWNCEEENFNISFSFARASSYTLDAIKQFENIETVSKGKYGTTRFNGEALSNEKRKEIVSKIIKTNSVVLPQGKALEVRGNSVFGQTEMPILLVLKAPNKSYIKFDYNDKSYITATNGDETWEYDPGMDKVSFLESHSDVLGGGLAFYQNSLMKDIQSGFDIEKIQDAAVDSILAYRMVLKKQDDNKVYYIDKRNYKVVRREVDQRLEYALNYQQVGSVLLPAKVSQIFLDGQNNFSFNSMSLKEVDDAFFEMPMSIVKGQEAKVQLDKGEYYNNRANNDFNGKEYKKAFRNYSEAIKINPNKASYFVNRSMVRTLQTDYYGAVSDLYRAIELDSTSSDAWNRLGLAKYYLNDFESAMPDFKKALVLDKRNNNALLNLGMAYMNVSNHVESKNTFVRLLQQDNENSRGWFYLGVSLTELGQYDEAISCYQKTIASGLASPEVYRNKAIAEFKNGEYQASANTFKRVIGLGNPSFVEFKNLGDAYYQLQQYDSALSAYGKARDLNGSSSELMNDIGLSYFNLNMFDSSLEHFNKAILLNKQNPSYYDNRAIVKASIMDYTGAIEDFSTSIDLYSEDAEIYYQRGVLKLNISDHLDGCRDLKKAYQMGHFESGKKLEKHCSF